MASFLELEKMARSWVGEVCIFGAGQWGKGFPYELIKSAGFSINCYFDNFVPEGTVIKEGLEVRAINYLYEHKENILIFLCVAARNKKQILLQLKENEVKNVIVIDWIYIAQIMDSVDKAESVVKKRYYSIYDDKEFLSTQFRKKVGYELNIDKPMTFNEKLQWLKLFDRNDKYTTMVDKYSVKKYITEKVGNKYVIPTLGVWGHFDDINFEKLPDRFVLKCTHDSGSTVLVDDKYTFKYEWAKRKLELALSANYYWQGREWPYKNVPRRIIAEKYMASPHDMVDYKFLCFHGNPKMVFTCTERFDGDGLKVTFFDLNWNRLDFERHYPSSVKEISKPQNLDLMIDLAGKLSEGIPFVRVDFYEIEGQVYFGEMTFFPGGGMEEFRPVEWDYILGGWIKL